jgi:hypothetical protein
MFAGTAPASGEEIKMSTTTETARATETKAPAKTTRAAKAVATEKAGAKAAEKLAFKAQGRGGKVNVRTFTATMTHAVDVADPDGKNAAAKAGLIYRFSRAKRRRKPSRTR